MKKFIIFSKFRGLEMEGGKIIVAFFAILIMLISCRKHDSFDEGAVSPNKVNMGSQATAQFRFEMDDANNDGTTVLGTLRLNPFLLSNINTAKTNLYGTNIPNKVATHTYVKFIPNTKEHLALLEDWETENLIALFYFPFEYSIVSHGEHYFDPSVADSLFTYQYAAIPIGIDLPLVPYQVIDDLFLDKSDPLLLAESFWLTDNKTDINEYVFKGGLNTTQLNAYDENLFTTLVLPEIPESPCPSGFEWVLVVNPDAASGQTRYYRACKPSASPPPTSPSGETDYCECFEYENGNVVASWIVELAEGEECNDYEEVHGAGVQIICNGYTPPDPPEPTYNACGCQTPLNKRLPGGCVRVENDFVMVPVQIAQVKVKDTWFTSDVTYTNAQGCWSVNKSYSGEVWMWVYFKNVNVKVRDTGYWFAVRSVKDYAGKFHAPPYNNIQIDYSDGFPNNASNARRYWAAAHTLNTVNEYRTDAAADGVPMPKIGLNWLNNSGAGDAAAPMLQGVYFSAWPAFIVAVSWPLNIFYGLTSPLFPDILNQYGFGEEAADFNGDSFHELGHASHYGLVGEDYWFGYRNHIINNSGYGTFGSFNGSCCPGRVALGEAIGNYIGAKYGNTPDGGDGNEWDNDDNFIPQGLLWDLEDFTFDIVTDPNSGQSGPDNISDFSPNMIFNALTPNVTNIRSFRDRLRTLHLADTPNNESDFNAFLDLYDVFN
ncbi:MAG: hypothetical protein KA479_07565 [Saprospiraceae bacterium]|nr:hypothetical protein [Saprospiraceae bacterium]